MTDGLTVVKEVMDLGGDMWRTVRAFTVGRWILSPDDERALKIACAMPRYIPSDKQAERLRSVLKRCMDVGFEHPAALANGKQPTS